MSTGGWSQITVTQAHDEVRIYLNGQLVAQEDEVRTSILDILSSAGATAQLGAAQNWADPASNGMIDEFKIYDRALIAREIAVKEYLEPVVSELIMEVEPDKTIFEQGEELDLSGMVVKAVCANGNDIITGKDYGTRLDPQGSTSRAETAVILQRFMGK